MSEIKTTIDAKGQPFVDVPVIARPKTGFIGTSIGAALFGAPGPAPIQIGYQRVNLKWVKPSKGA